jgi:hypothetical protein
MAQTGNAVPLGPTQRNAPTRKPAYANGNPPALPPGTPLGIPPAIKEPLWDTF